MIAKGEAKRMIVVMPESNPYPEMIAQGKATQENIDDYTLSNKDLLDDVIPFIEKNYNVLKNADNRAIAGNTKAGRQSLALAFSNPDKFHYVGAFAPTQINGQNNEIDANFRNGTFKPATEVKEKIKFVFIGTGKDDTLYQLSDMFDRYLTSVGIKHTFYGPEAGQTWMHFRDCLEQTVKQLFK